MKRRLPRIQIGSTSVENYMTRYIVHECIGCDKVSNGLCETYINPSAWFRNGRHCPLASHIKHAVGTLKATRKRVGQQKHRKVMRF